MAIMNGIQRPAERWEWAGTNWVQMRQRATAAMNARPAPQLPPRPAAQGKTEYVWGKEKPVGFKEGEAVLPALVKKAVAEALLVEGDDRGLVTVGGSTYIVEKKAAQAPDWKSRSAVAKHIKNLMCDAKEMRPTLTPKSHKSSL